MLPLIFLTIENDEQSDFMIQLYQEYYPLMKKIAIEHVYDRNDVEDVIQAALINLIKKVDLLLSFESYVLDVYIVNTIKNKCIDFNRKNLRERSRRSNEELDDVIEFVRDEVDTEYKALLKAEYEQLGRYMSEIPERMRDIILMKYIYGYDDKRIAKEMNIAKDSVRVYLSRGRKTLAAMAKKEEQDGL